MIRLLKPYTAIWIPITSLCVVSGFLYGILYALFLFALNGVDSKGLIGAVFVYAPLLCGLMGSLLGIFTGFVVASAIAINQRRCAIPLSTEDALALQYVGRIATMITILVYWLLFWGWRPTISDFVLAPLLILNLGLTVLVLAVSHHLVAKYTKAHAQTYL